MSKIIGVTVGTPISAEAMQQKMDLPTKLPNPKALTFTGAVTGSYDGSSAKTVKIPSSLKNPYALTINGQSYDGSSAVNLTIDMKSIEDRLTALENIPNAYGVSF